MNHQHGAGFPSDARLHNSRDFDAVFTHTTHRVSEPGFLVLGRKNCQPRSRLGMIVSKRITPAAVNRNRIKRAIRESFRKAVVNDNPMDIVVLTRRGIGNKGGVKVRGTLENIFLRLSNSPVPGNKKSTDKNK